ncbi:MAG: porin [Burkholderiaceae bacterium]|nr:porin [Burkholderiaceae bacterium]
MKKSLIAVAAMAVVGAASAQSSVTLYGIADIWVGKPEGAKVQAGSGGLAGSRWGIKGSEDLGGGLSANFNFESAVNLGNGATNAAMFDRQANVGFSGGFGALKIGRSWTAFDDIYGAANSGFDSALSANAVWINNYAYSNGTNASNAQIHYTTPTMGGFSGAFSTKLKGNETAAEMRHTAVYAKYEQGPIYAGVAYEKDDGPAVLKNTLVNGSYDLGMAKVLASYYTTKTGAGIATNSYQLGADIPMGSALTLSVGYASSKVDVAGAKSATGFGVAAGYSLSKRTTVYGGLRATNNIAGKDLWAVGVNHKF